MRQRAVQLIAVAGLAGSLLTGCSGMRGQHNDVALPDLRTPNSVDDVVWLDEHTMLITASSGSDDNLEYTAWRVAEDGDPVRYTTPVDRAGCSDGIPGPLSRQPDGRILVTVTCLASDGPHVQFFLTDPTGRSLTPAGLLTANPSQVTYSPETKKIYVSDNGPSCSSIGIAMEDGTTTPLTAQVDGHPIQLGAQQRSGMTSADCVDHVAASFATAVNDHELLALVALNVAGQTAERHRAAPRAVAVIDLRSGRMSIVGGQFEAPTALVADPVGRTGYIVATVAGTAGIWRISLDSGAVTRVVTGSFGAVGASPDGRRLAVADNADHPNLRIISVPG